MTKRIAALDLGTNLFHILIADISSQAEINPILKKDFMVQIGEGGMSAKQILPAAYQRGLTTMRDIHQLVTTYKVDTVLGCATSAIRDAENGKAFIKEVFQQTGIHIDIIQGRKEAELIHQGVIGGADLSEDKELLLIDIGGGSVELILSKGGNIIWLDSLQLGAARLAEKFPVPDPIQGSYFPPLTSYIHSVLSQLPEYLLTQDSLSWIGVNGAFETLSHMIADKQVKGQAFPHRFQFDLETYQKAAGELYVATREERAQFPGMVPVRIDNIILACAVIEVLAEILPPNMIQVSQYALLEGLIFEQFND